MARYPGATWKPVDGIANDPEIIPIGLILHVDAVNSPDLYNWWQNPASNGLESTFHFPLKGKGFQYRDTEREADANLKANSFIRTSDGKRYGFCSAETQGYGDGEWTDHQLDEIKRLYTWGHEKHSWKYRVCPGPFAGGLGFHTMWGAPSAWTPIAKGCPGNKRKEQFNDILVPWLAEKRGSFYIVKPGDTWRSIADKHDMGTFQLYDLNNPAVKPKPGQRLKVK